TSREENVGDGPEIRGTGGEGPEASGSGGADLGTGGDSAGSPSLPVGSQGLPLFAGTDNSLVIAMPTTDETGREGTFSISADEGSPRGVLSTHMHHYNFGTQYRAVEF